MLMLSEWLDIQKLIAQIESATITPLNKEDLRYNEGIRTAIMIIEAYEDSEET